MQQEKKARAPRVRLIPVDPEGYAPKEFCREFRMSLGELYRLWNAGEGPKVYYVGEKKGSPRISKQAARDWQKSREQEWKKPNKGGRHA